MVRRVRSFSRLLPSIALLLAMVNLDAIAQERQLTLTEKTNKAELILEGRVTSMKSEWNSDQTRIYTHVTISVNECLKGEISANTIDVTHLGGEVGDVGEIYSGVVRFEENEDVLVFLNKDEQGRYRTTGGSQGKYSIRYDEETNERMVAKERPLLELKQEILRIVKL